MNKEQFSAESNTSAQLNKEPSNASHAKAHSHSQCHDHCEVSSHEYLHNHSGNLADLMSSIPTEQQFFLAADVFGMLCDSTRLRILWLLCHTEECVSDIAAAVGMSSPAVSHHLRNLKQSGLITSRREGKEVLYTLAQTKEATLVHHMIDDIFEINCPR